MTLEINLQYVDQDQDQRVFAITLHFRHLLISPFLLDLIFCQLLISQFYWILYFASFLFHHFNGSYLSPASYFTILMDLIFRSDGKLSLSARSICFADIGQEPELLARFFKNPNCSHASFPSCYVA